MNKKKAQNRFVFACLAPAVILVFIFMVIPTIDVFKTAFFKKSNFVSDATFAGLFNFKVLFNDMRFIEAMQNTILYVVLITIITLVLAVLFATLLTREEFVGKNFFRVIFYIPNILSIVVIAGIFSEYLEYGEKKSYMAVLIWVLYVQLSLSMKRELSNGSSDPKK